MSTILFTLGSAPLFGYRSFLPAFLMMLTLYWPALMLDQPNLEGTIEFYIVFFFFLLALGEVLAEKNADLRFFYSQFDGYTKPVIFCVVEVQFISYGGISIWDGVVVVGDAAVETYQVAQAGLGSSITNLVEYIIVLGGAGIVFLTNTIRKSFMEIFVDADEDDDLQIQKGASWLEDIFVVGGFWILLASGLLAIILFALVILGMKYYKKRLAEKLEQQKEACSTCGNKNYPFATNCYHCNTALSNISPVGFLGQKKEGRVDDINLHKVKLLHVKCCANCGHKLRERTVNQYCDACGCAAFEEPTAKAYIAHFDEKFKKMLLYSIGLGFIPIIGVVVAIIWANISLNSAYLRYVPKSKSFFVRIITRILVVFVVFFGSLGGFILGPIYIFIKYQLVKKTFISNNKIY